MKAFLKNYRQSPRKVRLVADLIKGKSVSEAFNLLINTPKIATLPINRLLKSAVANAKNKGLDEKNLHIKELRVDGGVVLKRIMPRARGSAYGIKKRTSRVIISLEEKK